MATLKTKLLIRRDTAANWTSSDTQLSAGELGYESDTGKLKIGDGTTVWTLLHYFGESFITITGTGNTIVDATYNTTSGILTLTKGNRLTGSSLTADKILLGNDNYDVKASTYSISTAAPTSTSTDLIIPTSKAIYSALNTATGNVKISISSGTAVAGQYISGMSVDTAGRVISLTRGSLPSLVETPIASSVNGTGNVITSVAASGTSNHTLTFTKGISVYTKDEIDNKISTINNNIASGMTYKGTVGTGGTVTTLNGINVEIGDVYKVSSAGTYAGISSKIGDLFIATETVTSSTNSSWSQVPSGDEIYNIANATQAGIVLSTTTGTTSGRDYYVEVTPTGAMKVNVPWQNDNTTYGADRGISLVANKFGHSNTVTAVTNDTVFHMLNYDEFGHISGAAANIIALDGGNASTAITDWGTITY